MIIEDLRWEIVFFVLVEYNVGNVVFMLIRLNLFRVLLIFLIELLCLNLYFMNEFFFGLDNVFVVFSFLLRFLIFFVMFRIFIWNWSLLYSF